MASYLAYWGFGVLTAWAMMSDTWPTRLLWGQILTNFVVWAGYMSVAGIVQLTLLRLDGRPVRPFDGFRGLRWGRLTVIIAVQYVLCCLGGYCLFVPSALCAGLFMLALPLATYEGQGVGPSLRRSYRAIRPFMWAAAGLMAWATAVAWFTAFFFALGLAVGLPLLAITIALTYRRVFAAEGE
jgi:hypothetical protein